MENTWEINKRVVVVVRTSIQVRTTGGRSANANRLSSAVYTGGGGTEGGSSSDCSRGGGGGGGGGVVVVVL